MPSPASEPSPPSRSSAGKAVIAICLLLPYLGLCFPQFYARATPTLFGFPFFYWYQFAWVLITSLLLLLVYRLRSR